jgi:hypothetical protein
MSRVIESPEIDIDGELLAAVQVGSALLSLGS